MALICALLAGFLTYTKKSDAYLLIKQDVLDPTESLIESYAGNTLRRLNPYKLAQELPGLKGMAVVFGTQARQHKQRSASLEYSPLYCATIVIAVNQNGNSTGAIDGWHTLLESDAVVLVPHNATEGGRLAAIAMSKGLGAADGDFGPALEALARLNTQKRLNTQNDYFVSDYSYMYSPIILNRFDAVVLWDYQTAALKSYGDWEIIVPVEGEFSVDCGLLYGRLSERNEELIRIREYLQSDEGGNAFSAAGFSPYTGETELSAWDFQRLVYNPQFRRTVLSVKLNGPASVLERLLMQSLTLLIFSIAAQRILRRIPEGLYRATSLGGMLLIFLWMLIGIVKTFSVSAVLTRYCWFATYIPRHFLPVFWLCMCYVNRHGRLPSRKSVMWTAAAAIFLTVFVLTNDIHQQIFIYERADSSTWTNLYHNGWAYYLSLLWSFSLILGGLFIQLRKKRSRKQKRQMVYAGVLFLILLVYQTLYIAGVKNVLDLDIPTTVAICFLLFSYAAQRERFMSASLFALPVFHNSPFAIAVYDGAGQEVFSNAVMKSLGPGAHNCSSESCETQSGGRVYRRSGYVLDTGSTLILEDITDVKHLERSLKHTQQKLNAVRTLLLKRAQEAHTLTARLEQERYSRQMDELFSKKVSNVQKRLSSISEPDSEADSYALKRIRLLICICQRRLRFIIRSFEAHPLLPASLIANYCEGVMQDGLRIGIDSVFSSIAQSYCPSVIAIELLETIDSFCLCAFDVPGCSLVFRLESAEKDISLSAMLSLEDGKLPASFAMLPDDISNSIRALGGRICIDAADDGFHAKISFQFEEGHHALV